MTSSPLISFVISASLVVFYAGVTETKGQTIPIDDFNDGDDDGWNHIADLPMGGPGDWDASSGEYNLSSAGLVDPYPAVGVIASIWDGSVDPDFNNGYLRAKVRANNETTLPWLAMRFDGGGNLYEYLAGPLFDRVEILKIGNGKVLETLASWEHPSFSFDPGEDLMLEAGAVDDRLSLKFWKVGDPEPSAPQLTAIDTSYAQGTFGVAANTNGGSLTAGVIDATFDDITFTVPEPSTFALTLFGISLLLSLCPR